MVKVDPTSTTKLAQAEGWKVDLGAVLYDARDATKFTAVTTQAGIDYINKFDVSEADFIPKDKVAKDYQLLGTHKTEHNASTISPTLSGKIAMTGAIGFETQPGDATVNDRLGLMMELDAPKELLVKGAVAYHYLTYSPEGNYDEAPTTIGCKTSVDDKYESQVDTFKGVNSMESDSAVVEGKTWDKQNPDERSGAEEEFTLDQDSAMYATQRSDVDKTANRLQPCFAVIDLGKKVKAGDPILGKYTLKYGSRVYASETDTTFTDIPGGEVVLDFQPPETDLAKKYTTASTAEASETTTVVDERFKFDIATAFPTRSATGRGFQRLSAGSKVYGNVSGQDKWWFNLQLEIPKGIFKDNEVIYQYVTWSDKAQTAGQTGAVGCAVTVGKPTLTQSDEWVGVVNLSKDSKDVKDKVWYKQADSEDNEKKRSPDFKALWWDADAVKKAAVTRKVGDYEKQSCLVEAPVGNLELLYDTEYTVTIGARVYADDKAKTFEVTKEASFAWYRTSLTWSAEIEQTPTYEKSTAVTKENGAEAKDLDASAWTARAEAKAKADAEAAAAAAGGKLEAPSSKQAAVLKQSYSQGYQYYNEGINGSDWWWWHLVMDVPTGYLLKDEILYQYISIIEPTTKKTETIGC